MAVTPSTMNPLGVSAPAFRLPDTMTGRSVSRDDFADKPLLVMFICNHCPFVVHVLDELVKLGAEYTGKGVGVVAISSNDVATHPGDSPEKMAELGKTRSFAFPYLYDEDQSVARAFDAACTPDFFLLRRLARSCVPRAARREQAREPRTGDGSRPPGGAGRGAGGADAR